MISLAHLVKAQMPVASAHCNFDESGGNPTLDIVIRPKFHQIVKICQNSRWINILEIQSTRLKGL